jgi:hypothetical protein
MSSGDAGLSFELTRTAVTIVQGPFATEERRALHEGGWTESFARLAATLAAG